MWFGKIGENENLGEKQQTLCELAIVPHDISALLTILCDFIGKVQVLSDICSTQR